MCIKYRPPGWRSYTPRIRWSTQLITDVGTMVAVSCVMVTVWQSATASVPRALLLHATLGLSKALSLIVLNFLTLGQLFSCIILLVPVFYHTIGLVTPSVLLAGSLIFHAAMFEVLQSWVVFLRILALLVSFSFLATVRYDRSARNASQQLPTQDWVLNWEDGLRRYCGRVRVGVWGWPLAVAQGVAALVACVRYAWSTGARAEVVGDILQLRLAFLSQTLLLVAQDRRTFQQLQDLALELLEGRSLNKHL